MRSVAYIVHLWIIDHIYRNASWYENGVNLKIVRIVNNVYSNVKSSIRHCNTFF